MNGRARGILACAMLLAAGCEPAEDVEIQPLPPLQRPSPESRLGLPEVRGAWRFAGWEVAEGDSASLERALPGFGELRLETQVLDSVAGFYAVADARVPLIGEVRRDSVIALVALGGEGRYLAGRVSADTLWLSLSSLVEPDAWPSGARVAFVRSPVESPFVRLPGTPAPLAADTMPAAPLAGPVPVPRAAPGRDTIGTPRRPAAAPSSLPAPQREARPAETQPAAPRQAEPRAEDAPTPAPAPAQPPAEPAQRAAEPPAQPPSADTAAPRPPPIRLLGEPVRRDTLREPGD